MQASINLIGYGQFIDKFILPYDDLKRSVIESYLSGNYGLNDGYEISYVDGDGDEITVEFDDDYEVAKLTHEEANLILNVKVNNHEWIQLFKGNKDHKLELDSPIIADELLGQIEKVQANLEILSQQNQLPKSEQKVEPSLLQPLIKHSPIQQQQDDFNLVEPATIDEEIILKPNQQEETQILLQQNLPIQYKRTQTQTSELQSVDESSQTKPPKKKTNIDFIQDGIPFVQEESENQKPQVLEPKISSIPKEKKMKEKIPKSSKKPKALTEKDIKKLVKKEVLKLLPQIAEKIKFQNNVNESSEPQGHQKKVDKKIDDEAYYDISKCTVCSESLKIPFYVNQSEWIRMCEKCEATDDSTYPLIKIRSQAMLENLEWAQPLCYTSISIQKSEFGQVHFYSEVKKEFLETIKVQFDSMIKIAKDEAKRQKKEKDKTEKVKKQKKEKKEVKQDSLI